jgi:Inorganic H+ pyrophosphatase
MHPLIFPLHSSFLNAFTLCSRSFLFVVVVVFIFQFGATELIFVAGIVGLVWAFLQFRIIAAIPIVSVSGGGGEEGQGLLAGNGSHTDEAKTARLKEIYQAIYEGAESFLTAEYTVCAWFISLFSILILVLVAWGTGWDMARGIFTAVSFLLGALTSMASGYLGMKVAVFSNVRTTISAQKPGWTACFNTAFRAGAVMGFALCGLGLLMLYSTMLCFKVYYPEASEWIHLTESLTGYGLGGSVIAMFGRVGGGIYTKAVRAVLYMRDLENYLMATLITHSTHKTIVSLLLHSKTHLIIIIIILHRPTWALTWWARSCTAFPKMIHAIRQRLPTMSVTMSEMWPVWARTCLVRLPNRPAPLL